MRRPGAGLSGCASLPAPRGLRGGIAFPLRLGSEPERFHERLPFCPRFVDLVGMHAVVFRRSQQEGTVLRLQVITGGLFAIDGILSETFCQLSRISNRHGSHAPVTPQTMIYWASLQRNRLGPLGWA